MDYNKIEDAVMKKAMEYFKESAVNFFGIDTKIIAPAAIEIKNIDIKTNYMDYLFYTEDGSYLHFEFQTTDKKEDINRFLYYDTSLFCKENKKIRTIVVYSSEITTAQIEIDAGSIKYKIEPFYMNNIDGDEKLNYLYNKINNKEHLSSNDILALTFAPLMNSKESRNERAIKCIELAQKIPEQAEKLHCITLLYALFDKFGDKYSKNKFMGVISMTEIGRMLIEKGIAEGIEKGRAEGIEKGRAESKTEGKAEILIMLLIKKFKNVPSEYKDNIKKLPEETIDVIATDIFDFDNIEELKKYF